MEGNLSRDLRSFDPCVCDQDVHFFPYIIRIVTHYQQKMDFLHGRWCRADFRVAVNTYKLQSDITLEVNDYWPKEQRMPIILTAIA